MMTILSALAGATLPSLFVGVVLYRMQRTADHRYEQEQEEKRERAKEQRLQFELLNATADLSYATSMAIKRGVPNGEIEKGIEAYTKAKKEYLSYINERYFEQKEGV